MMWHDVNRQTTNQFLENANLGVIKPKRPRMVIYQMLYYLFIYFIYLFYLFIYYYLFFILFLFLFLFCEFWKLRWLIIIPVARLKSGSRFPTRAKKDVWQSVSSLFWRNVTEKLSKNGGLQIFICGLLHFWKFWDCFCKRFR